MEAWRADSNHHRPHSSLGDLTPNEFIRQGQRELIAEAVIYSTEEPSREWKQRQQLARSPFRPSQLADSIQERE
jgi:hypothetical protein